MRREFVIFEVKSDMAHFRRPYALTTALTYPTPPRTALCGLIGAIVGLPKNQSLSDFTDEQAIFGIQLLEPLQTGQVSLNLLDTKGAPKVSGIATFRPKPVNPHTIVRYEIIRHPNYRVYFSHSELAGRVSDHIANGKSHYTPCLGLAWMIAWFGSNVRTVQAEEVRAKGGVQEVVSPVRTADLQEITWNQDAIYQRIRMPAEMQPNRRVTRYEEYLLETTTQPIRASLTKHWRCSDGTCFSAL